MQPIGPLYVVGFLVVLAYLFVTGVSHALAHRFYASRSRHDLVVRSRQMRLDYLRQLARHKGMLADEQDVEIIEEAEPVDGPVGKIEPEAQPASKAA